MGRNEGFKLKLLTIGDSGVGKSWLLLRWAGKSTKLLETTSLTPTIGIDFKIKNVDLNGKRVKVQVWDTAGQERFRTITTSYYRNTHGILLVYDITDRDSFANIRVWMSQIQQHAESDVNMILVGNKCDLVRGRVVSTVEGENLAQEYNIPFIETSALKEINVNDAFMNIVRDTYNRLTGEGKPVGFYKSADTVQVDRNSHGDANSSCTC